MTSASRLESPMLDRPQQMLHAVFDRVKREAEKRAKQCAREAIYDTFT
jgi:hypothetical protein